MPSFTSMVEDLLVHAKKLDAHLKETGADHPTHEVDTLASLPPQIEDIRMQLVNGSSELLKLSAGPVIYGMDLVFGWCTTLTLRMLYHHRLWHQVPLDGTISYADLAKRVNLRYDPLYRFLRNAMLHNIFAEDPKTGEVKHTALTRRLATDQGYEDAWGMHLDELGPTSSAYIEALPTFGDAQEPYHNSYAYANKTQKTLYEFLSQDPERARRFEGAMTFFTRDGSWNLRHIARSFDWESLNRDGARIVDLGGGNGQVSQFLSKEVAKPNFVVMDLPHIVSEAAKAQPAEYEGRVTFQPVDFSTPQATEPATDAFVLRWILHNWPEKTVLNILKNLRPALRPGSKVLIFEFVLDDKPTTVFSDKTGSDLDIMMISCWNGAERSGAQFIELLKKADPRFIVEGFHRPEGSAQTLVEVTWRP